MGPLDDMDFEATQLRSIYLDDVHDSDAVEKNSRLRRKISTDTREKT